MKYFDLKNKNILVTGSSNGIGSTIAIAFAEFGANVVVNYFTNKERADAVVDEIKSFGVNSTAFKADVSNENQVKRLLLETNEFFRGKLDVLVNNAGNIFDSVLVENMELDLWNRTINTNLTSTFLVCKYAIPIMKKQAKGKIINMSSVAALNGGGLGTIPYAAAKAGIRAFSKGLAKELAPNIQVNCIAPGVINTKIHEAYITKEQRQKNLNRILLGREGLTTDIVGSVIFLSSEASDYITGETIEINGGLYMN